MSRYFRAVVVESVVVFAVADDTVSTPDVVSADTVIENIDNDSTPVIANIVLFFFKFI